MADSRSSLTGLSDQEAREFHGIFMMGFIVFTLIAVVAHFLVWMWRPWFPGVDGYALLNQTENAVVGLLSTLTSIA